jgi:hypothetical protein
VVKDPKLLQLVGQFTETVRPWTMLDSFKMIRNPESGVYNWNDISEVNFREAFNG